MFGEKVFANYNVSSSTGDLCAQIETAMGVHPRRLTLYGGRSGPASSKECGLSLNEKSVKVEEDIPPER